MSNASLNEIDNTDIEKEGFLNTFSKTFRKTLLAIFIVTTSFLFRDSITTYINMFIEKTNSTSKAHIQFMISLILLICAIILSIVWR